MRAHPDVIAALATRGITDMSLVLIEVWTYGRAVMPERYRDRRLGWCDVWHRASPNGNPYAHPVSGIKIIVDMNTMELLEIENDHDHGAPAVNAEYIPGVWTGEPRTDLKPLHITQPEGVSFTLDGTELSWQNWTMRIGFNYREGPVIHQVSYDDHGTEREIAYRLSFSEMVVPYRDASFDHYRRTAFDIGEWGLGFMTTSLELGCDCLGEIVYLDAVLHDTKGEPYTIKNAICIHEEDNAVLWKHVDQRTGAEVRRMRRLVVSCHATVANYEYLVYWRFYQDGNIECEVRATGLMVTTPFAEQSGPPATGAVVDELTYAPYHQHFLVARLDLDIDGNENTVVEVDSAALPVSADNPYGLAVVTRETPVRSESEAARDYNWPSQRTWKVVNPNRTNSVGGNVAYKLVPSASIPAADGSERSAVRAGAGHRAHGVGDPAPRRRAMALRRLSDAVRDRPRHDPRGSRTTSRWKTPTSSSGTCSASTTSPVSRTGRSCRPTSCRSGSSPPGSSTRTRPSTSQLLHRSKEGTVRPIRSSGIDGATRRREASGSYNRGRQRCPRTLPQSLATAWNRPRRSLRRAPRRSRYE